MFFCLAVVTVFDASDLESLSTCQRWMDDAVGANSSTPLKFLVATKMDLVVRPSCSNNVQVYRALWFTFHQVITINVVVFGYFRMRAIRRKSTRWGAEWQVYLELSIGQFLRKVVKTLKDSSVDWQPSVLKWVLQVK